MNAIHIEQPALNWPERLSRTTFAAAALAAYVTSFAYAGHGCWRSAAEALGLASAMTCIGFAAMVVTMTVVPLLDLLDICLAAMTPAAVMLLFAAAINGLLYAWTGFDSLNAHLVALWFVPVHQGWLLAANGLMAWLFMPELRRFRVPAVNAVVLWFGGFDAMFCLIYLLLRR